MSRFEGDIPASTGAELKTSELLAALGVKQAGADAVRQQAIACVLSASEGWREAAVTLGGAFAGDCGQSGINKKD